MNVRNIFLFCLVVAAIACLGWIFCGPSNAADLGGPPVNSVAVHVCPADCAHYQVASADLAATKARLSNYARSQGYEVVSVSEVPVSDFADYPPNPSIELSFGGAASNYPINDGAKALMVQGRVFAPNAIGPFSLNLVGRHSFNKGSYWDDKCFWGGGLEVPASRNVSLFADYERRYRSGDDWAFGGIRFRFGG